MLGEPNEEGGTRENNGRRRPDLNRGVEVFAMLLSSAEECPAVSQWLDVRYSDSRPVLGRLRRR